MTSSISSLKCVYCGTDLSESSLFCTNCGKRVTQEAQPSGSIDKKSAVNHKIYCRNCGKEVDERAEYCMNCGIRPLAESNYCQACGVKMNPNQEICIKCGVRLKTIQLRNESSILKTNFDSLGEYYKEEFDEIYRSDETYKGKWNWAAFLFGPLWALTKGVWLAPIISIVASLFTGGIAAVVYWFIYGARGNYMYYCSNAKNKQIPI